MSGSQPADPLQQLSDSLAEIVARAAPSVVAIRSHRARSSGFVWRPGLVVTADEALAEEGEIRVTPPGGDPVAAKLLGRDPSTDIALLGVESADLPPAGLGPAPNRLGALAVTIGARDGVPTAAVGAVSFLGGGWRSLRGGEIDARIELDLALRRTGEGSLVLDATGRGFGMAVYGPRRRVLVIPAATIDRVARRLETDGRIARGYLGLGLQPVRLDGEEGAGAMVMSADPKGPSAAVGIRQGDIILAWNRQPVRHLGALLRSLGPDSVGSTIMLSLRRGGAPLEIGVTIAERPES